MFHCDNTCCGKITRIICPCPVTYEMINATTLNVSYSIDYIFGQYYQFLGKCPRAHRDCGRRGIQIYLFDVLLYRMSRSKHESSRIVLNYECSYVFFDLFSLLYKRLSVFYVYFFLLFVFFFFCTQCLARDFANRIYTQ